MSDCEITGFTTEQIARWPLTHAALTSGETTAAAFDAAHLTAMDKQISDSLAKQIPHKGATKRRESLFNHLKRVMERRFKGSQLASFGSAESGLSLMQGDLDLCLKFAQKPPRKVLSQIAATLRDQDMLDVVVIGRAKVPIVKCRDERSGLSVDISVNNTLALHNTELLKAYANYDKRIKEFTLAVKLWALSRDISDPVSGSLSSYAWSLLAIQALQVSEPPVAPNLQAGEERDVREVEGVEYDLTCNSDVELAEKNEQGLGGLFAHFIQLYASTHPWDDAVVSIRNGSPLEREEKGWQVQAPSALESVVKADARMGEHSLSIEDPFDLSHDLSRVLWGEGALDIREEFTRALTMLNDGKSFADICEVKNPDKLKASEPTDLFQDLRDKPAHEVESQLKDLREQETKVNQILDALTDERKAAIRMAQAMRGVIEETSEVRDEQREIIRSLKPRNIKMEELQKQRDEINANIIIPLHMIEDELAKTYKRLTGEIDVFRVPSLSKEENLFSWFFELQAMHEKSKQASALHKEFIELLKEQKAALKDLKVTKQKQSEAQQELLKNEPLMKEMKLDIGEAREFDRQANKLGKIINERRKDRRRVRREIGRLEAWQKVSQKQANRPQGGSRGGHRGRGGKGGKKSGSADWKPRKSKANVQEVTQRAASGGSLSLSDLDVLLSSGGLSKMGESQAQNKSKAKSSKKANFKKMQNLSAHRGVRGKSTKGRKE